jgi:hypothetical protein
MRILAISIIFLCVSACSFSNGLRVLHSEDPTQPVTLKQQLRADPRWNAWASAVAEQVSKILSKLTGSTETGIYVASPENPTAVDKAFRSMVLTKLVQKGHPVTFSHQNALLLSYDVLEDYSLQEVISNQKPVQNGNVNIAPGAVIEKQYVVRVKLVNGEKVITNQGKVSFIKKSKPSHYPHVAHNS